MKLLKRFVSYYKPHRRLFFIDMLCSLMVAVADLFYPMITKNIINDYVPNQKLRLLVVWAAVLVGIYIVKCLLNYIISYYGHIVGVRMQADMRRDLFDHLEKLPFSYFDENKSGALMSRLTNDLFEVSELAHHGPENLFLALIMFIGSFILLSTIYLPLTLIIFCVVPFIIFFAFKIRNMMNTAFRRSREQIAEVNADIETAIAGIRVTRAYTAEQTEKEKFGVENRKFVACRSFAYRAMGIFHSGMTFLTDVLYLVVLIAGGLFFFYGKIDIGEFTAYLLYISLFLDPIKRFVTLFEQFQEGMTGFRRFAEIMETDPETDAPDAEQLTDPRGEIAFKGVSFAYKPEEGLEQKEVIHDLDLTIPQGKMVALVGPSGGGKTTICNLIPRFYELNHGCITIDGKDIRKLTRHSLRSAIGIVSQDVFLFNGTIRENIAYGNPEATEEQIIEAAKAANIHDYIQTLERGYDTNVGERGVKLSGGQKQRISIARVFLKNPSILILDEVTSALDNATEMQVQAALDELTRGRTVIVVAHRLSTVKNADEIIVLSSEGIVESGTHDELIAKENGVYHELYSYQFR
ncbi:MAG: ABC transporter ATP-binding protein [Clostridia bacterium]|nr:ABC transporter ATP-binding protein [Clostridia bacterium]